MFTERKFQGVGVVYIGPADGSAALLDVGDITQATLAVTESETSVPNFRTPGGGKAWSRRRVDAVTLTMQMRDFNSENLKKALLATVSTVSGTTVTDESATAKVGGIIPIANLDPTSVTVTDDPEVTTYVEGTDYEVTPAGILILASGSISDDEALLLDYTFTDYENIEALANSPIDYRVLVDGLNSADDDNPYVIDCHKVSLGALAEWVLLGGTEPQSSDVIGELQSDSTITTPGLSKFCKIKQKQAA